MYSCALLLIHENSMSAPKYRYGHGTSKRRPRKALLIVGGSMLIAAIVVGFVLLDLRKSVSPVIEGESRIVSQVLSESGQKMVVNEPTFTIELPGDWKETGRNENNQYTSITWQATLKNNDNRWLTIYIDRIPFDRAYNRIVTVKAQGPNISYTDISDNCANFTLGGNVDGRITSGKPTPTKWNRVDFICNLPRAIDNEVGTGSEQSPNSVTITGPTMGTHKYFFLYTDRNFQPDYNIFYDVLRSFRAK